MSKYLPLPLFKTMFPVDLQSTQDDFLLQAAVDWAEGEFERATGSQFNQQTLTNEVPARAWFDRQGLVTLVSKTAGPVTAVASVQYIIPPSIKTWQTLAWDSANGIFLPLADHPPRPDAWKVEIVPTNTTRSLVSADTVRFRWSYTAGYTPIPDDLQMLLFRLAQWKVKLREAPLGKVAMPPFGMTEVIPALPADIRHDFQTWTRLPS